MRKLFVTTILTLLLSVCFGQIDTILKNQQKGFLFLSAHNYMYDYKGGEIKVLGFHDFFFPSVDFNKEMLNKNPIVFTDGIRIDFFSERPLLKGKAQKVYGKDSSGCYKYDSFYIVPVKINLKEYKDNEQSICRKKYYRICTEGGKDVWFGYFSTAAIITKVSILPTKGKNN